MTKTYLMRKQNKLCTICGGQDENTLKGRTICKKCNEYLSFQRREKRKLLKEEHRCIECGKQDAKTKMGMARCEKCNERQRLLTRMRNDAKLHKKGVID